MAVRPYYLTYKGVAHIVEAGSSAAAVHHVVGAEVTELRPARASEVAAWARSGKPIAVAGQKPSAPAIESTAGVAAVAGENDLVPSMDREGWDGTDARVWLLEQQVGVGQDQASAILAWDAARAQDRLTLDQFDTIRVAIPAFADAIGQFGATSPAVSVDEVRASIEENPMAFADVVHAIGEQKRRELFVDAEADARPQ